MGELGFAAILEEAERLCGLDELEGPELLAFDHHVRTLGPQLSQDDLLALIEAHGRVQARIAEERSRIQDRLGHAGAGRRALKGYGTLRSARMCQRASRRI